MQAIKMILIFFLGAWLLACNATEMHENNLAYNDETSFPIDTTLKPADSIFAYADIIEGGIGEKNNGKIYWYLEDRLVLYSDIVKELTLCEPNKFLICVASPIPIILPSTLRNNASYKIGSSTFSLAVDERLDGMKTCEMEVLDFRIINEGLDSYRYVISKKEGLLYFSVSTQEELIDSEAFRLFGKVFAYVELCE